MIDAIRDGQRLNKRISSSSFGEHQRPEMKLRINPFAAKTQVTLTFYTNFD